jgi:hypothetical protein
MVITYEFTLWVWYSIFRWLRWELVMYFDLLGLFLVLGTLGFGARVRLHVSLHWCDI